MLPYYSKGGSNNCCHVQDLHQVSRNFGITSKYNAWIFNVSGLPGIVGAVDCTHIPIFSPGGEDAEIFRNRKGFFSINVQLISNYDLVILDAVARWPGSAHDSTIFDFSSIRAKFENNEHENCALVGDSGYPNRPYLLTPVLEPVASQPEINYNCAHVQARNCIERANGVLKRRFPALKYGMRIQTKRIPEVIMAAIVLHNMAILIGDLEAPDDAELSLFIEARRAAGTFVDYDMLEEEPFGNENTTGSADLRSAIIADYFS